LLHRFDFNLAQYGIDVLRSIGLAGCSTDVSPSIFACF
jgi:hypothetical protein